jgi:hypothetical protein
VHAPFGHGAADWPAHTLMPDTGPANHLRPCDVSLLSSR